MNILIVGSGSREHALLYSLQKDHPHHNYYGYPGNPGMKIPSIGNEEFHRRNWDLVIIGPEAPLVDGMADELRKNSIPVFGPGAQGAQLEGSKAYSKKFMDKYGIPTAKFKETSDYREALDFLDNFEALPVIKADGLAAGKGVFIPETKEEAMEVLQSLLLGHALGASGSKLVLEERLEGPEISFFYLVNKKGYEYLGSARDHKRAYDGDKGPNTGGMGTYSPVPDVSDRDLKEIEEIMEKTYQGILEEDMDYRGVVFIGCMRTAEGLKVLEYNVRFGDPETQVLMARFESDFLELALAVANNQDLPPVKLRQEVALCVVLASKGYPGELLTGQTISLSSLDEGILLFSGGTSSRDGQLVNSGGRVFSMVGLAESFTEARKKVYNNINKVSFEGVWYRKDIGENLP